MVKNPLAMRETWVRSLGQEDPLEKGTVNPLQYSGLENSLDRGAWRATVHRVAKSQTQLKQLSSHACSHSRMQDTSGKKGKSEWKETVLLTN